MFIWICAQWEEYHTGIMLYGNEYFGVLECNYSLAMVHVVTAIIGPELYQNRLSDYVPIVAQLPPIFPDALREISEYPVAARIRAIKLGFPVQQLLNPVVIRC